MTMFRLADLDRLTPEEVRAFKRAAVERSIVPRRAGGPPRPALVALGDSWFDYPLGTDIVDCLRMNHGYRIANHSQAGDTIENMVYGTRFRPHDRYAPVPSRLPRALADFDRRVERPILLVSGGGNDIAGEEFAQFLDHAASGLAPFRRAHAEHVIGTVFRGAYTRLIERAGRALPGRRVHIVAHGYGYPVPDGRGIGVAIGFSFIGPWLRPALAAKRIPVRPDGVALIRELIDMFNAMLSGLADEHDTFHVLDLRSLIDDSGSDPWVNELHVRNTVYARIAAAFDERIRRIAGGPSPAPRSAPSGRSPRKTGSRTRRRRQGGETA